MKDKQTTALGERIRSARMQLGYSRREFEVKFGISAATLQAWEDGKYPASLKGIVKYVNALYKAGLTTSQNWFINGTGLPPRPIDPCISDNTENNYLKSDVLSEDEIILREVTFFESINQDPIVLMISDDTMHPIFNVGDYVGGNKIPGKHASKYIGTFCIVTLDTGQIFIKKLKKGSSIGLYNLISINLESNIETAFLLDRKIIELAQIVWHRKNEKNF